MDPVKVARKLEPLMPKEVQHWLRVRDTADAETRSLIDRQIVATAHKVLGDFHNKILLSLPPRNRARGTLSLGTVLYDGPKWPAGISEQELLQNVAVLGRSGAGKTNAVFHLLLQLVAKRIPWLFLDWKRTARHLLPAIKSRVNVFTPGRSVSPFPFNPFIAPPGLEPKVYINHVIDALSDAYSLGDGARSILERALAACHERDRGAPTLTAVIREVERVDAPGRARGWKLSATRALESLAFSDMAARDPISQERLAQTLLHEDTIIELDALAEGGKKFLIPLLCLWLYYVRLAAPVREELALVIVLEEAHNVVYGHERRAREGLMNMLLRQCREIGIAMIVVDQHPHLLSSAALGNTFTSLCLNLRNPADVNKAAGLSMVRDDENKKYFSMLPVGHAIVKLQDRWRWPFVVQVPLVHVQKGAVTDTELRRYLRGDSTRSGRKAPGAGTSGRVQRIHVDDDPLEDQALLFLQDVLAHPEDGVKTRYRRLGMSGGRGNRIKHVLIDRGWLESAVIPVGRTRKLLLRLTQRARRALGVEGSKTPRESIAHEYWKRYHAHRLERKGYGVQLEAPLGNGRVDVLATRGKERVAVEVETGKSDVVGNVRRALQAKIDKTVVVVTRQEAVKRIEAALAEAGLLIPGRVNVVVCHWWPPRKA